MGAQIVSFERRVDASPNANPADTCAGFRKVQPNRDSREPGEPKVTRNCGGQSQTRHNSLTQLNLVED